MFDFVRVEENNVFDYQTVIKYFCILQLYYLTSGIMGVYLHINSQQQLKNKDMKTYTLVNQQTGVIDFYGNSYDEVAKKRDEWIKEEGGVTSKPDDYYKIEIVDVLTYDIQFNDDSTSNCKGFSESLEYCQNYIKNHNGSKESYFADYKGGSVSIVCNETEEVVFTTEVI